MRWICLAAFALCGYSQVVGPAASDQTAMIARMREAALKYSDRLEDFLCTEVMTRSVGQAGANTHWKLLETQELELGYIAHGEHYRLLKVNGQTTDLEKRIRKGYFRPGGEFGTALRWIFDPKAAAEFNWDHDCVFRYRVPEPTSTYVMRADADYVRMAHHGFVTADCSSGMVTRIQIETEPASVIRRGSKVALGMQLDVRYGVASVASKEFLLPREAVEIGHFGKTLTKAEIQFGDYRRYEANSKITFDQN